MHALIAQLLAITHDGRKHKCIKLPICKQAAVTTTKGNHTLRGPKTVRTQETSALVLVGLKCPDT